MSNFEAGFAAGIEAAATEASAQAHMVGIDDPTWQANARASMDIARRIRSLHPDANDPCECCRGVVVDGACLECGHAPGRGPEGDEP